MMKNIFCTLLFLLSGRLAAQTPAGNFTSHTDGQTVYGASITVTWKGCSNAAQDSYQTRLNGVALGTTQSSIIPCPDYLVGKNYSASGTLVQGSNNLFLSVCDVSGCGTNTITVNYAGPAVSVTPDGANAPLLQQGRSGSYAFKVKNTGAHTANAVFSNSCTGTISCSAPPPPTVLIAPGDSTTVTVSYTGNTIGAGRATLIATYNEFPTITDSGYVTVTVDPAKPSVNFISPENGQVFTSSNITVTWRGCTNAAPDPGVTRLNGNPITTTLVDSMPCPEYQRGMKYSAPATLRNGLDTLSIRLCDAINGCGDSAITVRYNGPAVSVTPDGGNAPLLQLNKLGSYGFKVKNTGAQPATANFFNSCTGTISCSAPPAPSSLPIAAGDSTTVTVSYSADAIGAGRAALIATYTEFPGITDTGYVNVTVDPAKPTATFTAPTDGLIVSSPNITITWKACSDREQTSADTKLDTFLLGTTLISGPACTGYNFGKNYSASATLTNGPHTLFIQVCDTLNDCGIATITVTYNPAGVSVTPDGASTSVSQGGSSSYGFKVKNTGTQPATASFTYSCATQLSSCAVAPASASIAAGDSVTVTVSYTGSIAGTGRVTLTATYNEYPSVTDNGYVDVTVGNASQASVTVVPVQATQTVSAGNVIVQFDVTNTSQSTSAQSTFTLTAAVTGSVTSCTPPNSVTLSPGAPAARIDVSCVIGTSGTAGSVTLTAATSSPTSFNGQGATNVAITPVYKIAVSPASGSSSVQPGTTNSYNVVIQNTSSNTTLPITVSLTSPSCSGVTLGSCSIHSNSTAIAQGSQTSAIALGYDALANGGETILFTPSGTVSGGTVQITNGSLNVTVGGGGSQSVIVAIAGKNPGNTIDKAGCLTIAAGQNAAYECSDLRVVHPLPATVTMDRARGPALIYNSRHANAGALLAADVTYGGSTPTILKATVVMPGQANIVKDFPWSTACFATACRIVVPISTTQPTGLYPVTLQVSAMNGSTPLATSVQATDTVIIVNRAGSSFGAGWWLDGLENLVTVSATKMLWVGGDGSSRLYSQSSNSNIYTVTPAYDRPDSLILVGGQTWQRMIGDGAYVEFNSAGQQVKTVNALGWTTTFSYTGGLLDRITLPVPAGSAELRQYRFWYTSSLLDSVQAPNASISRTTRIARSGSKINSITDPENLATSFLYDASNRIITRTNKLNDATSFQYDDGGALKQSSLNTSRTDGAGSAITTSFRAAETRSVYSSSDVPTLPSKVSTQLDGPRTDVGDTTNILTNRWGAPDSVTNALGQRTRLSRANVTFPALVTRVIAPNGFETRAFFNARALTDSTVAVDPYNTGANATTRFAWNPVWNKADSVIRPTGERTRTFYRTTRAIADSMRIGAHGSQRVKFSYTADNQVRSVTEPGGLPDSVTYDVFGNATKAWTPMGRSAAAPYFTQFVKDAIGRDTLVISPISGDTTGGTRFLYDAADRVVKTVVNGPARPYSLPLNPSFQPDTVAVTALTRTDTTGYDAEGNLTYKRSISDPESNSQLNEQMKYDAAGRLKARRVGTGPDSLVYDPAGNIVSARQRSGLWVTQSFDVLNRLVQRVVPELVHASERCTRYSAGPIAGSPPGCFMIFPFYPNAGDSLRIPADTSRFIYDASGNMTLASNRYARVRRTYFPAGAIKTDTTAIGVYSNPLVDGDIRGQEYTYDLSGRRTQMQWQMGPSAYSYNDYGALLKVTDKDGNDYRLTYTPAGRVDSLVLGTGVREKRSYDQDGRLVFKNRVSDYGTLGLLVSDSLSYDKANHLIRAWQEAHNQAADQTLISYDGLGAVVAREQGNSNGSNVEEFRNDAFGNMLRKRNRKSAGLINTAPFTLSYSVAGALATWSTSVTGSSSQYDRNDNLAQDFSAGRLLRQDEIIQDPSTGTVSLELAARHYYGADDRLMAVQRYSYRSAGFQDGTWEEYRYDALGRRIMTRARREPSTTYDATVSGPLCLGTILCRSFTERVWWDGDQALVEERTAEGTSDASNSGLVGNVHAVTLDEPLAVITPNTSETRIINYNWRGLGMSSVYPNGHPGDYSTGNAVAKIDWPAATQAQTYFTPALGSTPDNTAKMWLGTFVANGQGTTGMLYRRNRYFDTNTGRFTQEDPIGIAGGLNAYGFAAGDPVNFSDPFGLCGPLTPVCIWVLANLPEISIVGAEVSTGLSLGRGRLTGLELQQAGKAGEAAVEFGLLREGYTVLGRQVSARTSAGRRVLDFLTLRPDGSMVAIEAKAGAAVRNAAQLLKDSRMATEGARLIGKNVPAALRDATIVIPTEVKRP